jgi:hypothetical protein
MLLPMFVLYCAFVGDNFIGTKYGGKKVLKGFYPTEILFFTTNGARGAFTNFYPEVIRY